MNIPYVQKKISATATRELSGLLGVPVKIGKVDIEWLNRLVLEDLYLEDQEGKVMFEANHVAAGFDLLPLLDGRFVFHTVRLHGFNINLSKKTPSDKLNLQFVIDAFASKDSVKKETNVDLRFNSILIKRGNFSYNVASADTTPGKFNANHISIKNLSAKISLKAFNKDSLNANIKKMSFDESSGFSLNKLSLNIVANHDSAFINNFEIKLPQTDLKIDRANINLANIDSLGQLLNNAPLNLNIAPSQICLKDLSPFVPAFRNFTDTIELSAEATGYINNFDLKRLTLKYSEKMLFIGKMELKHITTPEEAYIFGQVNKMYITTEGLSGLVNNFSEHPVTLPEPIVKLGTINFTGEISGFFDNLVAFGKLSSSIGSIQTDLIFGKNKEKNIAAFLKGRIASSDLHINELFPENNPYGNARFDIKLDASRPIDGAFSGSIEANIKELDYKKYKYQDILLSGKLRKNGFNGTIDVNDPNGDLHAEGMFQHQGKNSVFNFTADLQHFRPDSLHLTNKYESPDISLSLSADFKGNNIDNVEGNITVDNLSFKTTPSDFFLKQLEITASGQATDRRLSIRSDILNGDVNGAYSFTTIVPSFMNTFKGYVPALINATQKKQNIQDNNFSLLLTIENTEALSNTLKLPFTVQTPSRITGHYNNSFNKFRIEAYLPKFKIGKSMFESGYFSCENPQDNVNLELKAINYNEKGLRNYLNLKADAKDNNLNALIGWANNKERMFKADISTSILFVEEKKEKAPSTLRTEVSLNASPLIIGDSLWNIAPAHVSIHDGKVRVKNFSVSNNKEYIHLDGTVSKEVTDTLYMDLKQIELSYIFDILNIPILQFGGKATGKFNIVDVYNSRMLNTDLEIQDFSFNQVVLGRLNLFSEWDDAQKGIMMLGSIYKNDTTWTDVNGYIYPIGPNDGLSLYFDANDLNIAFLHTFLDKVVKNLQGSIHGGVHLHGPFSALKVEGDAFIKNGGLGIEFLNTYYTFSDSIHLDAQSINFRDITIHDKFNNASKVNFKFNHKHFKDFDFKVNINADKMLLFDAPEKQNPTIYGTVFGSGTASIEGNEKLIDFDINMQSEPKTSIYLNFMNNNSVTDYDFISFVDKAKQRKDTTNISADSIKRPQIITDSGTELRMNFLVDITPDANIELIMDPIGGDRIKGNATGNLQIQYGTKSDLRMYGGVNIIDGKYNFSLQQIIHKDFKIREGSTIDFRGDPYDADMNVNAIYNLTANLSDLDQSLVMESPRPTVPVNCVLKLDGMLRSPTISFDLELPSSNEELERQMRSFIDTEDMMTRQIIYLLILNKFYTPDYASNVNRSSSNELNAVASSAISSQLSSLLNSFTDKVQIGANIRAGQDGLADDRTEMEMMLSSQLLDNRLLINGNFGYRNSYNNAQKNIFVGEFDLEYKLTKSGEIRLKAYNHANDMYQYLRQSLTTQGVGIMFKKDFTRPSEIFRRKRFLPHPIAPNDSTTVQPAKKDSVK